MHTSSITVRPLVSVDENTFYFRLATETFSGSRSAEGAERWQRYITGSPDFRAEQVRGAFRADQLLGGYIMHERVLRMGEARISTGCIGAVVTVPEARKQGVATALMQDTYEFARQNKHALLLLDGIPKFYFRYAYTDVFDVSAVEIDRAAILAQPATDYHVRAVTENDAAAILALYQRHYGGYSGSFERSPALQAHRLARAQNPPVVALSQQGKVEGYLFHGLGEEAAQGYEVAADTWEALLTLLHYHAHLPAGEPATATLLYFLPHNAAMTQWIIDKLEVPDTSQWRESFQEWGVRGLTYHHRFTGWMARLVNFSALMQALLPELQARWQRALARWSGEISLVVDGQICTIRLDGADLQLIDSPTSEAFRLELTPQALLQGVFGYRPFSRLADLTSFSNDACRVLALLFPPDHTWMPRTDWF